MLTITHTAEDGTLIDGTARGDGSAEVLKANRWRWSRNLGAWYIPRSRDAEPKTWIITPTAEQLRAAGFEVTVELDFSQRPAEEVEAARAERAAARAEALEAKAQRKAAQAVQAQERSEAAARRLPPGGEPIKVGHHSETRHRNAIEKAHNALGKAVEADREAEQAAARAETAKRATDLRTSPHAVANRLEKLSAELRDVQRRIDGESTTVTAHAPATGAHLEHLEAQKAALEDHLAYWGKVRAEQVAAGEATDYGAKDIAPGDRILYRSTWFTVARVNRKTVTPFFDAERGVTSTHRIRFPQIQDLRKAEG